MMDRIDGLDMMALDEARRRFYRIMRQYFQPNDKDLSDRELVRSVMERYVREITQ